MGLVGGDPEWVGGGGVRDVWDGGDVEGDAGAVSWLGVDADVSVCHADALDHRSQAEVQDHRASVGGLGDVEAAPVIGDLADQAIVAVGDSDGDVGGGGVLAHVGERLLHGAVDEFLDRPREALVDYSD